MKNLIIILSNHLSYDISSLKNAKQNSDIIALFELKNEATFVKHHPQKIAFWFASMRHFAEELKTKGFEVDYVTYNNSQNTHFLDQEIIRLALKHHPKKILITKPCEYRTYKIIQDLQHKLEQNIEILEDNRFLCSENEFSSWIKNKKQPRMEFFYRIMRQKYNILMNDDGSPAGGKWNYDPENRKSPPKSIKSPSRLCHKKNHITLEVLELVKKNFIDHPGDLNQFFYALNRKQALIEANHFIDFLLKDFGKYQDIMIQDEAFLYHSLLSTYINAGLLNPLELCHMAQEAFYQGKVPISAAEGFIRQILGWREYVKGLYWHFMPQYKNLNYFNAKRKLPQFYWDARTNLNCMQQAISHSLKFSYSHHIQRLMVTGNFALLAGINPIEVCEWYLLIYADAYEWVELPNTLGMALYGDGGIMASKPYAASGNYINKMSNFCKSCVYDPKVSIGPKACPFNFLYWNFFLENFELLKTNPRLAFVFNNIQKMDDYKKTKLKEQVQNFLDNLV